MFSRSWLAFAPPAFLELYGPSHDISVISIPSSRDPVPHFTPPHRRKVSCRNVQCYGLSGEGSLLAVAFDTGDLEVRSTSTGELLSAGSSGGQDRFLWLAFSRDGKYLLGEIKDCAHSSNLKLYRPRPGATTGSLEWISITSNLLPLISITFEGVLQSLPPDPDSLIPVLDITPSLTHPITIDLPFGQGSYLQSSQLCDALDHSRNPGPFIISDLVTTSAHLVGMESNSVSYLNPPLIVNNGESLFLLPHEDHYGQRWGVNQQDYGSLRYRASLPAAGGVLVFGGRCCNRDHDDDSNYDNESDSDYDNEGDSDNVSNHDSDHDNEGDADEGDGSEAHLDITIVNFRNLQSVRIFPLLLLHTYI